MTDEKRIVHVMLALETTRTPADAAATLAKKSVWETAFGMDSTTTVREVSMHDMARPKRTRRSAAEMAAATEDPERETVPSSMPPSFDEEDEDPLAPLRD